MIVHDTLQKISLKPFISLWTGAILLFVCVLYVMINYTNNSNSAIVNTTISTSKNGINFTHDAGYYETPIKLGLRSQIQTLQIRYTTDGSVPSKDSTLYNKPISLTETTALQAALFRDDLKVSPDTTMVYFINEWSDLPIVTITTDPDGLYNEKTGIYIDGEPIEYVDEDGNTRLSKQQNYKRRGSEWARAAHISLYEPDKRRVIDQNAQIRIHGDKSTRWPQKSFRVCAKGKLGPKLFRYKIFPEDDREIYDCFLLRNGGNDWLYSNIRDGTMQSLIKTDKLDTQNYRPSAVYLNGKYWGIYNIRDYYDKEYFLQKYGISKDAIVVAYPEQAEQGETKIQIGDESDTIHYNHIKEFIAGADMTDPDNYEYVKTQVDIDNFIEYYVANTYFNNHDWPHKNIRFWRFNASKYDPNATFGKDGRWRWLVYDTENGFSMKESDYDENTFDYILKEEPHPKDLWIREIIRSLWLNQEFQNEFINRMADRLNTWYRADVALKAFERSEDNIDKEIKKHLERWGQKLDSTKEVYDKESIVDENYGTYKGWLFHVNRAKEFAKQRPKYLREHLVAKAKLPGMVTVRLTSNIDDAGTIVINKAEIPTNDLDHDFIYFRSVPITIKVETNNGYEFTGWTGFSNTNSDFIKLPLDDEQTVELNATFKKL